MDVKGRPPPHHLIESRFRDDQEPQTRASGHEFDVKRYLAVLCSDRLSHNRYPDRRCVGTPHVEEVPDYLNGTALSEFRPGTIKVRYVQDKLFVQSRSSNRPSFETTDDDSVVWRLLVAAYLVLCTFLYGDLHALAWNAAFPSQIQRIAWRTSALLIASSGAAFVLALPALILCTEDRGWAPGETCYDGVGLPRR